MTDPTPTPKTLEEVMNDTPLFSFLASKAGVKQVRAFAAIISEAAREATKISHRTCLAGDNCLCDETDAAWDAFMEKGE